LTLRFSLVSGNHHAAARKNLLHGEDMNEDF